MQSGSASGQIPLAVGPNIITVYVASPYDYETVSYTITVTRTSTTNAVLSNLLLSSPVPYSGPVNIPLTPPFAVGTTGYNLAVPYNIGEVLITPTTSDAAATVKVNGVPVTSGSTSGTIQLAVGTNTINTVVTAADGVTTKTYSIVITRVSQSASGNSSLAGLTVSSGTLSPVFTGIKTAYSTTVANAVTSITVTANVADPTASITINGKAVTSGTASAALPLLL